ncbi:uncharacterized protein E0L32_009024 [Thyridium curvatum]|uniref:Uncharacterized protein n=1 Tax=Thyridium curvatum TaxID=1093900 RepID=A0A507APY8_9PEZI|nr:uncharacterized protein E0L32_009024 [Thyridium curvatum]TPX09833.1 hypothetical protein E0L32_009024 [Thyridium curvatum]
MASMATPTGTAIYTSEVFITPEHAQAVAKAVVKAGRRTARALKEGCRRARQALRHLPSKTEARLRNARNDRFPPSGQPAARGLIDGAMAEGAKPRLPLESRPRGNLVTIQGGRDNVPGLRGNEKAPPAEGAIVVRQDVVVSSNPMPQGAAPSPAWIQARQQASDPAWTSRWSAASSSEEGAEEEPSRLSVVWNAALEGLGAMVPAAGVRQR